MCANNGKETSGIGLEKFRESVGKFHRRSDDFDSEREFPGSLVRRGRRQNLLKRLEPSRKQRFKVEFRRFREFQFDLVQHFDGKAENGHGSPTGLSGVGLWTTC